MIGIIRHNGGTRGEDVPSKESMRKRARGELRQLLKKLEGTYHDGCMFLVLIIHFLNTCTQNKTCSRIYNGKFSFCLFPCYSFLLISLLEKLLISLSRKKILWMVSGVSFHRYWIHYTILYWYQYIFLTLCSNKIRE